MFALIVIAVVSLGILIFVHELGHFVVAKLCGVKVERFSLGFGPKLVGFQRGETEYMIAAVPLGGYVKMHGEIPEEWEGKGLSAEDLGRNIQEAAEAEGAIDRERSYLHKPIPQRLAIAFAGPAFNLIFGYVAILLFLLVQAQPAALVGGLTPGSPAEKAGLRPGDRIVSVGGRAVSFYNDFDEAVQHSQGPSVTVRYRRGTEVRDAILAPEEYPCTNEFREADVCRTLGIEPPLAPVLRRVWPEGPAARAGLQVGDRVTAVNGQSVTFLSEFEAAIEGASGTQVRLRVQRDGKEREVAVALSSYEGFAPDGEHVAHKSIGIETRLPPLVGEVLPGSAAEQAGLRIGDRIVAIGGEPIRFWTEIIPLVQKYGKLKRPLALAIERDSESLTLEARPRYDVGRAQYLLGFGPPQIDLPPPSFTEERAAGLGYAFGNAPAETWRMIVLIPVGLYKLVVGDVPRDQIGGPIEIGVQLAKAAEQGVGRLLFLLALISINLGILNLLPIPVLDGGHVMFFLVEAMNRRPVSLRTREIAQQIGLSLLLLLMLFALYNDIRRRGPGLLEWLGLS